MGHEDKPWKNEELKKLKEASPRPSYWKRWNKVAATSVHYNVLLDTEECIE